MAQVGRKLASGAGVTWRQINDAPSVNNQQAIFHWTQQSPGFLRRIGFWGRRSGSNNAKPQAAVYDKGGVNSGLPTPNNRLGYTQPFNVSAGSGSAGVLYVLDISNSSRDGGLGVVGATPVLLAGSDYILAVHSEANPFDIANPSDIPSRLVFVRTVGNGDPSNPWGSIASISALPGAIYAEYDLATAPTVTITAPLPVISTVTPQIQATTSDPDRVAPYHDRLAGYTIELRQQGFTALIWNPSYVVAPGSPEGVSGNINRLYDGPALTPGNYQLRISATDSAGAIGDFTDWYDFTIANLPSVETDVTHAPYGKQESGVVSTWSGKWVSPAGKNATHLKVAIYSGGDLIRGGDAMAWVALAAPVAPNGTLSRADSVVLLTQGTGILPLDSGFYTWAMKAKDVDAAETEWSDPVPFQVNFQPNQPTALRPISGTRVTDPPRVDWLLGDLDPDDIPGSELVTDWKVTRKETGTVFTGRTSNYDLATGRGFIQFTSTQFPAAGEYQVEVRAVDVSAETAGGAALATAYSAWSSPLNIEKITAPTVTIVSPTQGFTFLTASPQINFTVSGDGMTHYRIDIYDPADSEHPTFSSGFIQASNANSGLYTVPPGVLPNGQNSRVRVVTLYDAIESVSPLVTFMVQVPEANAIVGFTAAPYQEDIDYEAVTVQLSWQIDSTLLGNAFAGYVIRRRLENQAERDAVVIAHLRNQGQTIFYDYHAPPNVGIIYSISQLKRAGSDIQPSPIRESEVITLTITVPVIASLLPGRGADLRSPVIMLSTDYSEGWARDETTVPTWGNLGKPTYVRSPEGYGQWLASIGFRIRNDIRGRVQDHMRRWRSIVRSGHPYSIRTETEVHYVRIVPSAGWLQRGQRLGTYEVALDLEEIAYSEAVKIVT